MTPVHETDKLNLSNIHKEIQEMKRLSIGIITAGLLLVLGGCSLTEPEVTIGTSNLDKTHIKASTPQGGLIYEGQGEYHNSTGGKGYIKYEDKRHVKHTLYVGDDAEVDVYVGK